MKQTIIPIVFTFNDNYVLPAAIAIKSLVEKCSPSTTYKIYCLYSDVSESNRALLDKTADIERVKADSAIFDNAPATSEYPVDVYYRLLLHDIFPQYDKIIYSDVDVLFQGDLTSAYHMNLDEAYWAGVPLEANEVVNQQILQSQKGQVNDAAFLSGHTKFEENKNSMIYASGFMVINAKKMREDSMTNKFYDTIRKFAGRLKMFDLDVLNIACQHNTIKPISFNYCVLEDIALASNFRDTNLYPFLSKIYKDEELFDAINHPIIMHYTGSNNVRIWNRSLDSQPLSYKKFCSYALDLLGKNKYASN